MSEFPISTAIVAAEDAPAATSLTLDMLNETMREGREKLDKLNDQLVESLLLGGFRVVINDAIPDGMIAVLPGDFRDSLKRVMAKLRAGDPRFGLIGNLGLS